MSHAAAHSSVIAGTSGFAHVTRMVMIVAALVAALLAGAAIFGHASSVAASPAASPMPDATVQMAGPAGTDLSVPRASAVFSGQEAAGEEPGATF